MILTILYGFLIVTFISLYMYLLKSTKRKLPPASKEAPMEPGLPLLGVMLKIKHPMHHYLMNLGKKLGNIFRIKLGMREVFILNDYEALKLSLKDESDNFSGRWNGNFIKMTTKNTGILLIDGDVWAKQRSFVLKILRDFRLGSSRTNEIVQNECTQLLADLNNNEGTTIDFSKIITMHTVNIISEFLMKKRYSCFDEEMTFFIDFMRKILTRKNLLQILHLTVPAWDNSEICSKIGFSLFFRPKEYEKVKEIFTKEITRHRKFLDLSSEGEDFMDRFLIEQFKLEEKTGSQGSFTDLQLVRTTFEMLAGGYDSTSLTITWGLLFLSKHQEVQHKMHSEIVGHLGLHKIPSMTDRKVMPYTEAVIDEILRLSSASPLAVFHRNFHDTVINGIFIPKNSFIIPNLYACHRDAKIWQKPFEFCPEHFLTFSENSTLNYRPREELLPFGLGKRQCLGESLARAEIFIFLAGIIQQFSVNFSREISEQEYQEALQGDEGPVRYPKIKEYIFERYENDKL